MRPGSKVIVRNPRGSAYEARYLRTVSTHNGPWAEVRPLDAPKDSEPRRVRPAMIESK